MNQNPCYNEEQERRANRMVNWFTYLFCGAFLLGGFLITLAGVMDGVDYYSNKPHYAQVDAQIMEIREEQRYDAAEDSYDTVHRVFVCYTYDGVDYTGVELNRYTSSMEVDDIYRVEIDTRYPEKIVGNEIWLMGMGGAFLLVAWGLAWMFGIVGGKKT